MPFEKNNTWGQGRPKARHTILAEKMREAVVDAVNEKLPELLDAKFDLALGHYETKDQKKVYKTAPDANSIQYLLNQVIGKALEKVEMDNPAQREELEKVRENIKQWIIQKEPSAFIS